MKGTKLFVKIIFGIVLAILVTSFLNVGISLFYPAPEYLDYCDEPPIPAPVIDEDQEIQELYREKLEEQRECEKEFENDRKAYDRVVFFILAPIGLILLIVGTFTPRLTIQIMLMGSGFASVVIGILRNLDDKLSVFITVGILIIIGILFTIKKLKD